MLPNIHVPVYNVDLCVIATFRFLLARHKAAIDVYNEAEKMKQNDWVCVYFDLSYDSFLSRAADGFGELYKYVMYIML